MDAIEKDYSAWRYAPWGGDASRLAIVILGEDLSAAVFKWLFADSEGGSTEITLNNASAGSEGVSASYDADYVHPTGGHVVGATTIVPQIDESTLEGLTYSGTSPLTLFHMLYITPSGGTQYVERHGDFTIRQGAVD